MTLPSIVFYILSSGAIISSIMVISARNPIHSILFLVLVFFNVAGLLILVRLFYNVNYYFKCFYLYLLSNLIKIYYTQ